ncbi:proline--tRNA ligase [Selenihalanaerobacter shriftii]|uniref:Proline--tRNA ligase n=1 Tax=Selenihalanaerobacter shriftii TaxID=142842 RepID=A0A1T4MDY7_9FIRM|nr:proline--tRNA ligase [Selenihalanaerobacter shriftii]SJZ65067.1 prolyl-tRNA synthetase [Selenihalanaerobacter shriftii]
MKMSKAYIPTLKETPSEAEVVSHKLMLRAGMMRKLSSGIYTYLPLGQKVIQKIEEIVREEMNREGAQELLLPALQPAELWQESERWNDYGPELMRLQDRHDRDFCLGPTHEEVITDLVRDEVRSYKDLPLNLYQVQTKFRDEIRPRFGVLRGREFIMKDGYSFDVDEAGLEENYQKMFDAYDRIFDRCGLDFRPVVADNGAIGGSESHEFMVLADSGEDTVVFCSECDYAANLELAVSDVKFVIGDEEKAEIEKVETPGVDTIESLAKFLDFPESKLIKTLAYQTEDGYVLALVRGDYQLNEIKLRNLLGAPNLEMADGEELLDDTGVVTGFAGPIETSGEVKVVADPSVMEVVNGVTGANEADYHYVNVNAKRDFDVDEIADIREIKEEESCIYCGGDLTLTKGIEVGQVFKLGTKYSEALGATYLDNNGKAQPMVMGCYGIGITRTVAAAIEQNHDEYGIIWPAAIAPYEVSLLTLGDGEVLETGQELYQNLKSAGIDVLFDERKERAGVKFNDADLIGASVRITIGSRSLAEGKVEVKVRSTGDDFNIKVDNVIDKVAELLNELD